eukprot:7250760-Alexandrium_andersonii.AAC.1
MAPPGAHGRTRHKSCAAPPGSTPKPLRALAPPGKPPTPRLAPQAVPTARTEPSSGDFPGG